MTSVVAIAAVLIAATAGPPQITSLGPDAFPEIPSAVRSALQRRGCRVPQPFASRVPRGVIRGSFYRPGVVDVAILCMQRDVSVILIFRGANANAVEEFQSRPNANYMQTIDGAGRIGFSRAIAVASPAVIRRQHARYGGPLPKQLDHDGIDDLYVEKASTIWYWQGRQVAAADRF
jgi:hypothetical protein